MEILEENSVNYLVRTEDGGTTTKTKDSNLNKLLYGQGLAALLEEGSEIWMKEGAENEPSVTLIPDDEAKCYTMRIGAAPDLTLSADRKTDLIDALASVYEDHDGERVAPLLDIYDEVRDNMVRPEILRPFLGAFTDKVEERDDGWFIHDHLLLTYEGNFYHSDHVSRTRSGSVIGSGMAKEAYDLDIDSPPQDMNRTVTVDGDVHRLTNPEAVFIAKVVWAIQNTPDRT